MVARSNKDKFLWRIRHSEKKRSGFELGSEHTEMCSYGDYIGSRPSILFVP